MHFGDAGDFSAFVKTVSDGCDMGANLVVERCSSGIWVGKEMARS